MFVMTAPVHPETHNIGLTFAVVRDQRCNTVLPRGLGKEEARDNRFAPQLLSGGGGSSSRRRSFLVATSLFSAARLAAQDQ